MSRILHKSFRYTPVAEQGEDYLKRRFAKIKAELKAQAEAQAAADKEAAEKVAPLKRAGK